MRNAHSFSFENLRRDLARTIFDSRSSIFNESIWIYAVLILILILLVISLIHKDRIKTWNIPISITWLIFISYLLVILLMAIPNLIQGHLHIDESQHIGEANTLAVNPKFWLMVDGTTIGPVAIYILLLPHIFNIAVTFLIIRVFNYLLWFLTAFFVYKIFRLFKDRRSARIYTLPLIILIGLFCSDDYVTYNGETTAVLFLTISFFMILKDILDDRRRDQLILGFLLGIVPFTKIQVAPVALILGFLLIIHRIKQKKEIFLLIIGAFIPVLILFIYLFKENLIYDFTQSYIFNNYTYATSGEGLDTKRGILVNVYKLPITLFSPVETRIIFILGFLLYVISKISKYPFEKYAESKLSLYLLSFLFSSMFVIALPGNIFYHYSLLLIVPTILIIGFYFDPLISGSKLKGEWVFIFLFCIIPSINTIFSHASGQRFKSEKISNALQYHPVSMEIIKLADPGDKVAVWGWDTYVYAETGLLMGTREAHTQRQIFSKKQLSYYANRYLEDLNRNKPEFFIDFVNENHWIFDSNNQSHEKDEKISEYIDKNYVLVKNVGNQRIYRRK